MTKIVTILLAFVVTVILLMLPWEDIFQERREVKAEKQQLADDRNQVDWAFGHYNDRGGWSWKATVPNDQCTNHVYGMWSTEPEFRERHAAMGGRQHCGYCGTGSGMKVGDKPYAEVPGHVKLNSLRLRYGELVMTNLNGIWLCSSNTMIRVEL